MHASVVNPSAWVTRFCPLITAGGRVLDLAAGSGRHSLYLAKLGFSVLAVDRDAGALELLEQSKGGLAIKAEQHDLEGSSWPLADRSGLFDAVVVTNYLYRPYLDLLPDLLAEGGVLIYETFAHGNAAFGKPSNPDFLLQTGELLDFAARRGLHILAYSDLYQAQPKPAMVQSLCAVKGGSKTAPSVTISGMTTVQSQAHPARFSHA
jgi:SAM-dependent methyltransferase